MPKETESKPFVSTQIEGTKRVNIVQEGIAKLMKALCGTVSFRIEATVIRSKSSRTNSGFSIEQIPYKDADGRAITNWSIQFTPSTSIQDCLYGPKGLKACAERFYMKALRGVSRGKASVDVETRVGRIFESFRDANKGWESELSALIAPAKAKKNSKPSLFNLEFRDGDVSGLLVKVGTTDPQFQLAKVLAEKTGSSLHLILGGAEAVEVTSMTYDEAFACLVGNATTEAQETETVTEMVEEAQAVAAAA